MTCRIFNCHAYDHQDIYIELVRKLNSVTSFDWVISRSGTTCGSAERQ